MSCTFHPENISYYFISTIILTILCPLSLILFKESSDDDYKLIYAYVYCVSFILITYICAYDIIQDLKQLYNQILSKNFLLICCYLYSYFVLGYMISIFKDACLFILKIS